MRILITNFDLDAYAGTQIVVRDLAVELQRQGHEPLVYSPRLGAVAQEIKKCGIEVTDQLSSTSPVPDVIHGHHHQTLEALLRFPSVPAIYVCHGAGGYVEAPFYFPRIQRYVAVDERCKQRLAGVPAIPHERIEVIWNAVDTTRFQPRDPLPVKPKRALVFSNNAHRSTHLPAVNKACRQAGLQLDVIGGLSGNPVTMPETVLPRYDIVFAKARCALEALAVGNAVVLCDQMGLGPMVSSYNFEALRPMNFGAGLLRNSLRAQLVRSEIQHYDAQDAAVVSERVRKEACLAQTVRRWIRMYEEVIKEFKGSPDQSEQEYTALADYLKQWNYGSRIEWEWRQLGRLQSVPLAGNALHNFARRIIRKRSDAWKLP